MSARRRRILVAEDSPTQAEGLRLVLEAAGYDVELARDGREGLERVRTDPPDLVVSDVVMPRLDGYAFCQALKADEATRRIPFVLLTTRRTPMDIIRGLELGADNFITKPFEDEHLVGRVERIFANLEHRKTGGLEMEVSLRVGGREIVVNADKQQMIELLFSTSEELVESNRHLEEARRELEEQARGLERAVEERTRELRQAEEKYRALVEQIPAVIYIASRQTFGRSLYMSPQIESLLGFSLAEWEAEPDLWLRRIHPQDQERVLSGFARLGTTEKTVALEYRLLAREGQEVWVRDEARVGGNGQGGGFVQGVLLDVTERRRAEEALHEEQRLKTAILESLEAGIVACDAEGTITLFNRAALEFHGIPASPLPPERWAEHFGLFRADGTTRMEAEEVPLFRALKGEHVRDAELVIRSAGLLPRTVLTTGRPIRDAQGAIRGAVAATHDITQRKRTEEQLLQSQKMEAVGQLAGGVAHDFNNLLGVILGYGDLLARDLGPDHPGRSRVEQIHRASERAAALTRQLLAFSRKQVLQPEVLDLNGVVGELDKMLRRLIGEHIEVVTVLAEGLGRVKADPGQVEQVIVNLAVNARDAMPNGGKLIIETSNVEFDETYVRGHAGSRGGPHVMLAVSDTGTGIGPETLPRIFEPFFTTKETGKGTGLGLSTVYGIVKQSGGYVSVYSEPGRGSTFKVYLPRVDADARPLPPAAPRGERLLPGTGTILLVEDEESLREMIREVLEASGYRVLSGPSPAAALDAARSHAGPIHLLLTDVVLPKMSGRELARTLEAARPGIGVLYMSGYTDEAISHHGLIDPDVHFLQKPFSPEALLLKVRALMEDSQAGGRAGP